MEDVRYLPIEVRMESLSVRCPSEPWINAHGYSGEGFGDWRSTRMCAECPRWRGFSFGRPDTDTEYIERVSVRTDGTLASNVRCADAKAKQLSALNCRCVDAKPEPCKHEALVLLDPAVEPDVWALYRCEKCKTRLAVYETGR